MVYNFGEVMVFFDYFLGGYYHGSVFGYMRNTI